MKYQVIIVMFLMSSTIIPFRGAAQPKKISPDLFGIFFEDISYAADGGLYGELVQNGSFEYTPADRKGWSAFSSWDYVTDGFGYGNIDVETAAPVNENNKHYLSIRVEEPGQKGIGIANSGFDGIAVDSGKKYRFSVWLKAVSGHAVSFKVLLKNAAQQVCGASLVTCRSGKWQQYHTEITIQQACDSATLYLLAQDTGTVNIDMVSLFPEETFMNRPNGMRKDIAEAISMLHPRFMRFPGGCLVHGDGVGNMYNWKNTIGPLEQRKGQRNIWGYHQSVGLGYFEYFQFCEDIGAKPLPVLSAGVSCQNSGGTWRIGGTGQRAIPLSQMPQYIRDILDLIEYANGDITTVWGAKRAAAGHPASFHLQYIGIGNEDKQTDAFRQRFKMIFDAIRTKHPEITVVGTAGPFPSGEDYDLGWGFADTVHVPVIDEHYYEDPGWFVHNQHRYDDYDRSRSKVYVGEYASKGNTLWNALAEAAYMTSLERNADIVKMASYAPLLANSRHTSWNPDLIYFNNRRVLKTANFYVQQMFSNNEGSVYYPDVVKNISGKDFFDTAVAASAVEATPTGSLIIKIVNLSGTVENARLHIPKKFKGYQTARRVVLAGNPKDKNTFEDPEVIVPQADTIELDPEGIYSLQPYSLNVIRISP